MKQATLILLTVCSSLTLLHGAEFKVFPSFILQAPDSEDVFHPMVGVDDGFPAIVVNRGIQKSPTRNVRVQPTTSINDMFVEVLSKEEDRGEKELILNTRVRSSNPMDNVYAALVYTTEDSDSLVCKYDAVGSLSGEPQHIQMRFPNDNLPRDGWSLHFYQSGLELYNPADPHLKDATPMQAFSLALGRHVAASEGGDANPAPFYMPVPAPDPSMLPEGDGPYTIKVKMKILANGRVDNFMFPEDTNPDLQVYLTSRLGEWLFLPRIKEGERVDQTVVLPLQLR